MFFHAFGYSKIKPKQVVTDALSLNLAQATVNNY